MLISRLLFVGGLKLTMFGRPTVLCFTVASFLLYRFSFSGNIT